jgi:dihydroneopterin aldolase
MIAEVVVKVGGSLLSSAQHLDPVLAAIAAAARGRRITVVPGGGLFADAVREACRRVRVSDEASHWMAVLAMDQFAHLLAERLERGALVESPDGVQEALDAGAVPVLAPFRWLRRADPLPHTWDVTSDSIAAWVAGQLGARQLALIKPPGSEGDVVDLHFHRALPRGLTVVTIPADQIGKHLDLR